MTKDNAKNRKNLYKKMIKIKNILKPKILIDK